MGRIVRRTAAVLMVAGFCLLPARAGAGVFDPRQPAEGTVLALPAPGPAGGFLAALWRILDRLWANEGISIDPDG